MSTNTFGGSDHWIYFGDGNAAQIIDSRTFIRKKTGIKYYKFVLIPSKRIELMYDIDESQDEMGAVVKEYKATDVLFLERGIVRTRCWISTDFMGNDTTASRRYSELTEVINDTERLLKSTRAAKNRALQELDLERQQKAVSLKIQSDMLREFARGRGRPDQDIDDTAGDIPD